MTRKLILAFTALALVSALFAGSAQARRLSTLIAPTSVCANQTDLGDSPAVQEQAMRCLTDFARQKAGLGTLGNAPDLDQSAARKNSDIIRCDSFSHYACGRQFTYWIKRTGYLAAACWRAGENIAWGTGDQGDVRSIFTDWIHSPEHLANLLGRYSSIGISLSIGNLEGHRGAHVWTQDFGSHGGGGSATAPHHQPRTARPHFGLREAFIAH